MVSFDNAVTAFDIPSNSDETDTEADQLKIKANNNTAAVHHEQKETKLPLNDTVTKDDPDSFTNKLREAILRYDTEQQMQMEQQANKQMLIVPNSSGLTFNSAQKQTTGMFTLFRDLNWKKKTYIQLDIF